MEEQLNALFTDSEKQEIVRIIDAQGMVAPVDTATFGKFIRRVERWFHVVGKIADGYLLEIDSYRNDMHGRRSFIILMAFASDETASKIEQVIKPADDIYFEATEPLKNPKSDWWSYTLYDKRWWRKPKKLIGSLKECYEKEGIE